MCGVVLDPFADHCRNKPRYVTLKFRLDRFRVKFSPLSTERVIQSTLHPSYHSHFIRSHHIHFFVYITSTSLDMSQCTQHANGDKVWYNHDGSRHRVDGPAVEDANGHKEWWVDGKLHRLDGPAVEFADGDKQWCVEGQCHRLDGPAIEHVDGLKEWWIFGEFMTEEEHQQVVTSMTKIKRWIVHRYRGRQARRFLEVCNHPSREIYLRYEHRWAKQKVEKTFTRLYKEEEEEEEEEDGHKEKKPRLA
jgi:hypothetical protein